MHVDYLLGNTTTGYGGLVRSYADEPVSQISDWTQAELMMYLNQEHRHLFSKIRNLYEDWFMRDKVFPLVTNQYKYQLPRDCVNPRRIEYLNAQGVSGSAPDYVVNETMANPEEVQEVMLSGKDNLRYYTSSNRVIGTTGYYLMDRTLQLLDDSRVNPSYYCRIYYLPTAPDLHRAVAQGAGASTLTLGSNTATTTLGTVSNIDNYYKGMWVEIIHGTGKGQLRFITAYNGATGVATLDEPWVTVPNSASHYSIVSPIIEDFQELLALGTTMRAKGLKVEDDTSSVAEMYGAIYQDMIDSLERRNNQQSRRVIQTQRSGVWY
jgi:hypothetical protein